MEDVLLFSKDIPYLPPKMEFFEIISLNKILSSSDDADESDIDSIDDGPNFGTF